MNIAIAVEMTFGRRARNARQQLGWVGWAFRAIGVGYIAWGLLDGYMLNVAGLIFVLLPEIRAALVQYVIGRKYGRIYTYTLSDEGVRIVTAITNLEFAWAGLKSLRETGDSWNFRLPGAGFTVPKAGFTPEQDAEWRAFAAGHQLVKS